MGNEAIARSFYDAMSARDCDRLAAMAAPSFEMRSLVMEADGDVFRGPEGARRFVRRLAEVFPDFEVEIEAGEEAGERALLAIHTTGHGAGSGIAVDQRGWALFTVRDGLVCDLRLFRTEAEARDAMSGAG
jgi:ketosteroid isomerase-like protein